MCTLICILLCGCFVVKQLATMCAAQRAFESGAGYTVKYARAIISLSLSRSKQQAMI